LRIPFFREHVRSSVRTYGNHAGAGRKSVSGWRLGEFFSMKMPSTKFQTRFS